MRRLTMREVSEQYGGILPPDAVFRPDEDEVAATVAARTAAAARPAPGAMPKRRTRSERFAALNAFTDCALADLTGAEAKVWLILFRDTKAATGTARTGQADLARRAGLSRRGVQVALDKLQARGLVIVVRRGRLNGGPSVYRVHPTGETRSAGRAFIVSDAPSTGSCSSATRPAVFSAPPPSPVSRRGAAW